MQVLEFTLEGDAVVPQCFFLILVQLTTQPINTRSAIRDWSLITWRAGGLQNGRGQCEVLPLRKGGGGAEKVVAMLMGVHKKFWDSFYAVAFSHIEGGAQKLPTPLKVGRETFYPVLRGNVWDP